MQQSAKPLFTIRHDAHPRAVAFSPRNKYIFCSGGYDSKILFYSARHDFLGTTQAYVIAFSQNTQAQNLMVTGMKFSANGDKLLAVTGSQKLIVVDVKTASQITNYNNCLYSGRDKASLLVDPNQPNVLVVVSSDGKGLTMIDFRVPTHMDFAINLYESTIKDMCYLDKSWLYSNSIVTTSSNGTIKIVTFDGQVLNAFKTDHKVFSVCCTPEKFSCGVTPKSFYGSNREEYLSVIMCAGEKLSYYWPQVGMRRLEEKLEDHIMKVKYNSCGSALYSACDGGAIKRYNRHAFNKETLSSHAHYLEGEVYRHKSEIWDFDISRNDDYLVTASRDGTVGLKLLGSPSHGIIEYAEIA